MRAPDVDVTLDVAEPVVTDADLAACADRAPTLPPCYTYVLSC